VGLSVIGAGFGRTGTMSLKIALEQLGFGPCHHMDEIFGNPNQLPHWQAAAAGESVDWDAVYAGYNSTVDWPGTHFWRELTGHYPNAKVILTMRSTESWWESYSKTIMIFLRDILPEISDDYVRDVGSMGLRLILKRAFAGSFDDKEVVTAAYDRHVAQVTSAFSEDRLLLFDVRDGWEPLCTFLGRPIPDEMFPRTNSPEEFWEIVKPRD
jgi:hypothetical protein